MITTKSYRYLYNPVDDKLNKTESKSLNRYNLWDFCKQMKIPNRGLDYA